MPHDETELQIEVPPEHFSALAGWLGSEDALRGRVRPVRQAPEPGQMGALVELLTVALSSGGAGVVLVRSLCTWLTQHRADVTVLIKGADGREVLVDVRRASDPSAVIRDVAALTGSSAQADQPPAQQGPSAGQPGAG